MGNFIGYSYSLKAYKIFNPENGKILVHKDVKVDEDVWYNCEEQAVQREIRIEAKDEEALAT